LLFPLSGHLLSLRESVVAVTLPSFRQFHEVTCGALSYLLAGRAGGPALLIDPVRRHVPLYLGVIDECGLQLAWVVETHLHADHLSGAAELRQNCGARIAVGAMAGIGGADLLLHDGDRLEIGDLALDVIATPGHTPGCLTLQWQERLFTGDALLIGSCGSTLEPGGNAGQLYDSVCRRLMPLTDETLIYPGHACGDRLVGCIGEERLNNPMFRGLSRDEFIAGERSRRGGLPADFASCIAANSSYEQSSSAPI
jgi:sulfur dioxygenase